MEAPFNLSRTKGESMRRSLIIVVVIVSCVLPYCVSAGEGGIDRKEEVETPEVTVIGERIERLGTGTLHLEQQSVTSSRLGLTLREIPASIEVIGQQTIQERGFPVDLRGDRRRDRSDGRRCTRRPRKLFYAGIHE